MAIVFPSVFKCVFPGPGLIIGPSIAQSETETETETETEAATEMAQTLARHKLICTNRIQAKKKQKGHTPHTHTQKKCVVSDS